MSRRQAKLVGVKVRSYLDGCYHIYGSGINEQTGNKWQDNSELQVSQESSWEVVNGESDFP